MKYLHNKYSVLIFLIFYTVSIYAQGIIINHNCIKLSQIPDKMIDSAKTKLCIAYGHTSHGSQLIDGMSGLYSWKGDKYAFGSSGKSNELEIHDYAFNNYGGYDLGNPDRTTWAEATRDYLNNTDNSNINVVIWSWCGEVSSADSNDIVVYLNLMSQLEIDYPEVTFVYMTGHLDGTGISGNLNKRNEQIRKFCIDNNKILYDFADIESYDPDGNYFLDKLANDACDYDSDSDLVRDKNWATDWQNAHTEGVDWYNCGAAHSQPINANMKAIAAWWLWTSIANSKIITNINPSNLKPYKFSLEQNYPNPFNPTTTISYSVPGVRSALVSLKIYDMLGREVKTLVNKEQQAGKYSVKLSSASHKLSSGVYFYQLRMGSFISTKKMLLLK
jgi:hypothetical protein